MNDLELYNSIVFGDELSSSVNKIEDFFANHRPERRPEDVASFDPELAADVKPKRGLAICITPRTGSTALSTTISNTTKAIGRFLGYPAEYFNLGEGVLAARSRHYGCQSFEEYVERALIEATDPGETFSIKGDFVQLFPVFATEAFRRLAANTTFVHLYRRDVVAQAVSLARAHSLGVWNSSGEFSDPFELSNEDIAMRASTIARMDAAWSLWFSINGIQPLRVAYEDIVGTTYYAIGRMYNKVHGNLDNFPVLGVSKERITRNASSFRAAKRFREHFNAGLDRF